MARAQRPNELRLVRTFDVPIKLVWESWTEDRHISKWWGPRGFSLTTKSKEMRPGGKWIYTMHGPDGVDYPNITTYHVVSPFSKLVYDHGATVNTEPLFRVSVTFEEVDGKTLMDMTMSLTSPEAAREIKKFIKSVGGDSTWDRLGEYLESSQKHEDVFLMNRSFETSIKTMFNMWIDPKHFSEWVGPAGTDTTLLIADIKEGSSSLYRMKDSYGVMNHWKVTYKTIRPEDLFIYTQSFCDKDGFVAKPSFESNWPNTLLTTVRIAEEGPDDTRVTIKSQVYGEASQIERETFRKAKPAMATGWTGSFDKLEEILLSS